MKRVFIIHGWEFDPDQHWYPWLKEELEKKGYEVFVPQMPNTETPRIEEWVPYLAETVGLADKNTFFVGHSIGCQTIMRFLQMIDEKIGGAVFVAPWLTLENLEDEEVEEVAKPWLETPLDFEKIKKSINKLTVIISDNDPYGGFEYNVNMFKEKLDADVIVQKGKGHFTKEDGVLKIDDLLRIF